jgi:hypothetical protein
MSPGNTRAHRRQWILGALAIMVACVSGSADWYIWTGSNPPSRTAFIARPTTSPTRQGSSVGASAAPQALNAKPSGGTRTETPSPSCGTWEQQPGPGTGTLWAELRAVAATNPDDAWAVGVQGDNPTSNWGLLEAPDGAHILITHWDGKHWVVVPGPDMGGDYGSLQAVAAIRRDDVWTAGIRVASGPGSGANVQALILHWDGQKWSLVAGPGSGPAAYKVVAIAASATDDVWAIGAYFTNSTGAIPMLHWDGQRWNNVPGPPNTSYNLRSLVAISKSEAWAVGSRPMPDAMFYSLPVISQWDGAH